jgi:hypothetical protein
MSTVHDDGYAKMSGLFEVGMLNSFKQIVDASLNMKLDYSYEKLGSTKGSIFTFPDHPQNCPKENWMNMAVTIQRFLYTMHFIYFCSTEKKAPVFWVCPNCFDAIPLRVRRPNPQRWGCKGCMTEPDLSEKAYLLLCRYGEFRPLIQKVMQMGVINILKL